MAKNVLNYAVGVVYVVVAGLEIVQSGFSPETVLTVIADAVALMITAGVGWLAIKKSCGQATNRR